MKLVAKKDLLNVPELNLTLDDKTTGFVHKNHVHKGHRFSIGTSEVFEELKRPEKKLVVDLLASESVIIDKAANKSAIDAIDAEVKADAARAARLSKLA